VIGVHDLDGAIAHYRRAFALSQPRRQKDVEFGAELAWFEGSPIVLAQGLDDRSWLSRRVREDGEAPCAFVLKTERDRMRSGTRKVKWFDRSISWMNEAELGFRLGTEIGN
jgi:hypothetical protein